MAEAVSFNCVVICGSRQMDQMMHSFDVFEKFKALATPKVLEIKRESEPADENLEAISKALREGLEAQGERVVAVFFPGKKAGAWVDNTVKVISDGKSWGMLRDALKAYKFAGEYNEIKL